LDDSAAVLALLLERELLEVATRFEAAGIEYRVLKGPAHAHLLYPDPSLRAFGDIDLLVPSDRIDDAIAMLEHEGGERRYAEPRRGFDRRFSKGACLTMPSGLEVDLHRTLVAGPYGLTIELERLFERPASFVLAGRALPALALEERLIDACYHGVLAHRPPRLLALRDIALMAGDENLDVDRVLALARAWSAEAVIAQAVTAAWSTLQLAPGAPLARWAGAHRPDRAARRRLDLYTGAHRSYAAQSIAAVAVIPKVVDKAAYAFAIGLPKRAPNRARASTRWRRGARAALRRRRP
jgi:hypothetical protein